MSTSFDVTYNQNNRIDCGMYSILIPDGFTLLKGRKNGADFNAASPVVGDPAEGRDFIAYRPNILAPGDYTASDLVLFAGQYEKADAPYSQTAEEIADIWIEGYKEITEGSALFGLLDIQVIGKLPTKRTAHGYYRHGDANAGDYQIVVPLRTGLKLFRIMTGPVGKGGRAKADAMVAAWLDTLEIKSAYAPRRASVSVDSEAKSSSGSKTGSKLKTSSESKAATAYVQENTLQSMTAELNRMSSESYKLCQEVSDITKKWDAEKQAYEEQINAEAVIRWSRLENKLKAELNDKIKDIETRIHGYETEIQVQGLFAFKKKKALKEQIANKEAERAILQEGKSIEEAHQKLLKVAEDEIGRYNIAIEQYKKNKLYVPHFSSNSSKNNLKLWVDYYTDPRYKPVYDALKLGGSLDRLVSFANRYSEKEIDKLGFRYITGCFVNAGLASQAYSSGQLYFGFKTDANITIPDKNEIKEQYEKEIWKPSKEQYVKQIALYKAFLKDDFQDLPQKRSMDTVFADYPMKKDN